MDKIFDQTRRKWLILVGISLGMSLLISFQVSWLILGVITFILLLLFGIYFECYSRMRTSSMLINSLEVPAILVSKDIVKKVNPLALELFQSDIIGCSYYKLFNLGSKGKQQTKGSEIVSVTTRNGLTVEVELRISKVHKDFGMILLMDRTEIKEQREKLQHLDQLSSIGELAAGIAHEIRNPITSLKGFLQLMDQSSSNNSAYTGIMLTEINRINSIVSELLLIAKPKGLILNNKNLVDIIKTVITLTSTQAILYNIQIQLNLDEIQGEEVVIKCDENKLKQVFINMIKNAIEAMRKEGKILISIKRRDDDFIEVSVVDEGEGISKEKLSKLGKQFFSTKQGGTGLGVMISANIIEDMVGSFKLIVKKGKELMSAYPYLLTKQAKS